MSCYKLSNKHWQELTKQTIYYVRGNNYTKYRSPSTYNLSDLQLETYIKDGICALREANACTMFVKYGELEDKEEFQEFKNIMQEVIKSKDFYKNNNKMLVELLQAYKCTDYQIETHFDRTFIDWIKNSICSDLAEIVVNQYENDLSVRMWGY